MAAGIASLYLILISWSARPQNMALSLPGLALGSSRQGRLVGGFAFCDCQDKFDHNKGQKSAISGHRFHWIVYLNFLRWMFVPCSPGLSLQFRKEIAPKCGENCPISERRKKRRILSRLWLLWFFFFDPEIGV